MAFFAAVVLLLAFAAAASASPNASGICSDCHAPGGAAPIVTITSAPGADPVHYSVTQSSTAWAAYDLSTPLLNRIAGDSSMGGSFTAPAGHFVRVCSADGNNTGTWTQAYILTPTAKAGGAIAPVTPQVVAPGGSQAFTITADPSFHIADVTINGVSNQAAVTTGAYTFQNVQADGKIVATFAAAGFNITATAGDGGSIATDVTGPVASGGTAVCTVTANAGFAVDTVLVDGVAAKLTAGKYTFSNVTAQHTIAVTFKKVAISVTLTGVKSGVVKLNKSVTTTGKVTPLRSGKATVTIQRKVGTKWVKAITKAVTINATSGKYSLAYKCTKKGSYRVQVSVAAAPAASAAKSTWKTFKVK